MVRIFEPIFAVEDFKDDADFKDDFDAGDKLNQLIKLIKKYRDEKIFDHLNVPASFIPVAGPITNIVHGVRRGNTSEIVTGSIFLACDVFTFGAVSLLKNTAIGSEKLAVVATGHMGDIARGIRQGAKGLKPLVYATKDAKNAVAAANSAKGALRVGKAVGMGVKAGTTVIGSGNALRLGTQEFNNEEREIIELVEAVRTLIGEELYNILDQKIIGYINNPICSPNLNKVIRNLEGV